MPGPFHPLWYVQEEYKLRCLSLCSLLLPPFYSVRSKNFPQCPVPHYLRPLKITAFKGVRTSDLSPSIFFPLLMQETKFSVYLMLQLRCNLYIFIQATELMKRKRSQHLIGFNFLVNSSLFCYCCFKIFHVCHAYSI
jgi:hypothetical protein